jgi:tryptophan halogenase
MKIAIIGVGTAGVHTLCYLSAHLPNDFEIYSIHDPDIKILGIGESTTTALPQALWKGAGFTMLDNADDLDATTKHGVKYINWTPEPFNTHILPPFFAMHFNNFKLGEVVIKKLKSKWGNRFTALEGKIEDLKQDADKVEMLINGVPHTFDYIVDCRGYPDDYTDYEICKDLPVNHALIHTIEKPGDWNYTYHQAHKNGWMFGIPLQTRQGWGYLFNDTITTKEEAMEEMAEIFNTTVDGLNLREFSFKNYYSKKPLDGRIFKNGNRALFFEPLEALSGYYYDSVCVKIVNFFTVEGHTLDELNYRLVEEAQKYENFIHFVYNKGSIFDTPFWKITKEKTQNHLDNSPLWKEHISACKLLNYLNQNDEAIIMGPVSIFLWNLLDEKMRHLEIFNG